LVAIAFICAVSVNAKQKLGLVKCIANDNRDDETTTGCAWASVMKHQVWVSKRADEAAAVDVADGSSAKDIFSLAKKRDDSNGAADADAALAEPDKLESRRLIPLSSNADYRGWHQVGALFDSQTQDLVGYYQETCSVLQDDDDDDAQEYNPDECQDVANLCQEYFQIWNWNGYQGTMHGAQQWTESACRKKRSETRVEEKRSETHVEEKSSETHAENSGSSLVSRLAKQFEEQQAAKGLTSGEDNRKRVQFGSTLVNNWDFTILGGTGDFKPLGVVGLTVSQDSPIGSYSHGHLLLFPKHATDRLEDSD